MSLDDTPLVSFIIPYYNHNHFIKLTLDSILEDTYPNKEIILINDGSPDPDDSNIVRWINQHGDDININYIKRENKGLTKTLNELISLSKGKYITICASDDYYVNNTITDRVAILEKNPHKLLLLSDNIVIDDRGKQLYDSNLFSYRSSKKKHYMSDNGIKYAFINKWSLAGACYIVNRDIYNEIGLYNEELIVEDWDFFLRAAAKNLILFYAQQVSAYRLHDTNTINNPKVAYKMYQNQAHVARKSITLFSFPFNLLMVRRYIKYKMKLMKIDEVFPYNIPLWKKYKQIKHKVQN